jgi:hypothetical protein
VEGSESDPSAERAPHINDVLATHIEAGVCGMGRTEDEDLAPLDDLIQ